MREGEREGEREKESETSGERETEGDRKRVIEERDEMAKVVLWAMT